MNHVEDLQAKVDRLRSDVGAVLHSYAHVLATLSQTIAPVIDFLGLGPSVGPVRTPGADQLGGRRALAGALEQLLPPANRLGIALDAVLAARGEAGRTGAWDPATWDRLAHLRIALDKPLQGLTESAEVAAAYFREIALAILTAHGSVRRGCLPREPLRRLGQSARDLGRLACLLSLASANLAVVEMDAQLRALRENLTLEHRQGVKEDIGLLELVRQATSSQAEYLRLRDIELRNRLTEVPGIAKWFIRGSRRDLVRALVNLLHNAIKYSWNRSADNARPWVELRVSSPHTGRVGLSIRNLGVPIGEDELSLVFEMGYRGRHSAERNRAGTGVGLHDALQVARMHDGDVTITSEPATPGSANDPDYYSRPFVTTATLTLPVFSREM